MIQGTAEQFEEARNRNVNATHLAAQPIAYDPARMPNRGVVELKVDGIGLLDVNGNLQSLEGVPFEAARHLAHELDAIRQAFGTEMVLQGEFHEPGGFNATLSAFNSGQSEGGMVALFDAVPLKAWHGYEWSTDLFDRRALLQAAVDMVRPGMVSLLSWTAIPVDLPAEEKNDFVQVALDHALAGGFEGLVLKDADSPYQRGPSPYWMKVKPDTTVDVPIQAVRIEDGRVRSIVVTFEGKPCVVGSGISEALRVQPDEFPAGRLVEIRHVGRTQSGALRGTSFCRFRDDKEKRHG